MRAGGDGRAVVEDEGFDQGVQRSAFSMRLISASATRDRHKDNEQGSLRCLVVFVELLDVNTI
jgi:hypothetical protein